MTATYHEFLKEKVNFRSEFGFQIDPAEINPLLKPHQRAIVEWAVLGGRRAIFAAFGLGKSVMQIEALRLITERTGGAALIVCPLGVRQEFKRDAAMLGQTATFIRAADEITGPGLYLTNYETIRDGKLDPNLFAAVSLDEASCFAPGTLVETGAGLMPIETVRLGTEIPNAAGLDRVSDAFRTEVTRAVRVKVGHRTIISSDNHLYFTTRGWVAAAELRSGDCIVETATAMRMVRNSGSSLAERRGQEEVLRSLLLSEMASDDRGRKVDPGEGRSSELESRGAVASVAPVQMVREDVHAAHISRGAQEVLRSVMREPLADESAGHPSTAVQPGIQRETGRLAEDIPGIGRSPGQVRTGTYSSTRPGETHAKESRQALSHLETDRSSTTSGREWDRADHASAHTLGGARRGVGDGIRNLAGVADEGVSDGLQGRHRKPAQQNCNRSGRELTPSAKSESGRRETGCQVGVARVDGVEVLEPGHPDLEQFRDADGRIYFYDLTAARHPSYSIEGLLVHNCLRSYGSKTFQTFLPLFEGVKYRFVATATPAPNRYKELIHYAGFLGVMDTGQALTRFFQRDSTQANNLTLYPHKEREFWLWLNTWAVFLQKPSDLGFSDEGYDLPPIEVVYHEVAVDHSKVVVDRDGQAPLFRGGPLGVSDAAKEKRDTMPARVAKVTEIVNSAPEDHFILWHDLEDERRAIKQAMPEAVEVYGSLDLDIREQRIIDFSDGKSRLLATKPELSGSGCNLQRHCHRAIFAGVGFKFNDFIQACHRIQRFQQTEPVRIDIVHAESEREVVRALGQKWARHKELTEKMTQIIKEHGLNQASINDALTRSMGIERVEASGEGWLVANNDCVDETARMDDNSVDLIVTSIPFANHYEYTPCFDAQTEVLTKRGWLSFGDLTLDDQVATANPETMALEWQHPRAITWQSYSGPMLRFESRNNFDLLVTPDHRMFVDKRVGNRKTGRTTAAYKFVTASEVHAQFAHRRWRMHTALTSAPRAAVEPIPVPCVEQRHMPTSTIIDKLDPFDFAELAGWYLSEGYVGADTPNKRGVINIAQSLDVNPIWRQQIIAMFDRIGLTVNSNNPKTVAAWSIQLAHFLRTEFGAGSYDKRIPRWVKDLDHDVLVRLRDTMMKGDGNANGKAYTSVSHRLRDDFQEIAMATGWRASISGDVVRIAQRSTRPEIREAPETVEYSGMIGCATLPNGTLVVRRNGKAIISGNSYNDFGHTDDNDHFWAQMDFLTPQLLRVLRPGRIYACHVKDRILFGNTTGAGVPTVSPFHAEALMHGRKHGFDYLGMITVVTDVVRENNQTYRLGWSEQCKDATKMGVGSPEYILLFHKPQTDRTRGYADTPVTKSKDAYSRSRWQIDAHAFWRSSGDRHLSPDELAALPVEQRSRLFTEQTLRQVYDYESHVKIGEALDARGALPATFMSLAPGSTHPDVWHDINRMLTLNTEQSRRAQAMHVCLARGSLVLTRGGGYKPIEQVTVGEQVLTHLGRWRPVLAVQNTGVRPVVQLKAQGVAGLVLTPDHKVWARDVSRFTRAADYARRVTPTWVPASDTIGSYINRKLPSVEMPGVVDPGVWWVVGRWLADGHIDVRGCAVISCGKHEQGALTAHLGAFGGNPFRDTGTALQVQLRDPDRVLRNILKVCGTGAAGKHMPPEAYTLPTAQAEALLDGYLSGDGHYRADRRRWMASSVSRELLLGVAHLAQRVHGAIASIYPGRPARRGVIAGRAVSMRDDWILGFDLPSDSRRKTSLVLDDGAWMKVRAAEPAGEVETWNLRVAEDGSYTAEGIVVKNCPLQFDIVDRIIARFSNQGELVYDPFGGLFTVPVRALHAGRRGRAVELNPGYFLDGVKYLQAEERKADMPGLFDLEVPQPEPSP